LKRLPAVAMMEKTIGDTDDIMQQTGPNLLRSKTENNEKAGLKSIKMAASAI
jgi:hypothetical protein